MLNEHQHQRRNGMLAHMLARSKVLYHIVMGKHVGNCQRATRGQRPLLKSTKRLMKRGVRQVRGSDRFGRPVLGTPTVRTMQHFQGDQGEVPNPQFATIRGSMSQILCGAEVLCGHNRLEASLHAGACYTSQVYVTFVLRTERRQRTTRPVNALVSIP